jgi:hypothetical protein
LELSCSIASMPTVIVIPFVLTVCLLARMQGA